MRYISLFFFCSLQVVSLSARPTDVCPSGKLLVFNDQKTVCLENYPQLSNLPVLVQGKSIKFREAYDNPNGYLAVAASTCGVIESAWSSGRPIAGGNAVLIRDEDIRNTNKLVLEKCSEKVRTLRSQKTADGCECFVFVSAGNTSKFNISVERSSSYFDSLRFPAEYTAKTDFSNDSRSKSEAQSQSLSRVDALVRGVMVLSAAATAPDSNGAVVLNIVTNVDTASLLINGDEEGGKADGRYSVRRFAPIGESRFEIQATDRLGNVQRQTVSVARTFTESAVRLPNLNPTRLGAAKSRDAVAIIIGIEKYRRVPSADFASRDANLFVDYAQKTLGVRPENIRLLTDDKAESSEILLTLRSWLPTRVNRDKTDVFVFYSGHGLPSPDGESLFLLPYDVNRDLLDRTAISQKEVIELIAKSNPRSATIFMDACYSGQTRTGETLLASARPISVSAKQGVIPRNFTIFSSSAPDQISSSSPEVRHGIFSYFLMRGIEGEADQNKDGQISVGELQAYLSEQVTRQALSQNRVQRPQVAGDTSRILVAR